MALLPTGRWDEMTTPQLIEHLQRAHRDTNFLWNLIDLYREAVDPDLRKQVEMKWLGIAPAEAVSVGAGRSDDMVSLEPDESLMTSEKPVKP